MGKVDAFGLAVSRLGQLHQLPAEMQSLHLKAEADAQAGNPAADGFLQHPY